MVLIYVNNLCNTVLTTNKERTSKEQVTFFKKNYLALIRNKYSAKIFYQANCGFFCPTIR